MTTFATFDNAGLPTGFYNEDIHGPLQLPVYGEVDEDGTAEIIGTKPNPDCGIPLDAVTLSDDQWRDLVTNAGRRRWDGATVVEYLPPPAPVTGEDVNAERQRRIASGKVIDGVHVTGTDEDARNLTNLALAAQLRLASGDTGTLTTFRDGDNVDHQLTPEQVLSIWQQSAAYVSALYEASWALKALDPIPADYVADDYWP